MYASIEEIVLIFVEDRAQWDNNKGSKRGSGSEGVGRKNFVVIKHGARWVFI